MSFLTRIFGARTNEHYTRGIVHFNRQEYDNAVGEFELAVAEIQDHADPDYELARFYSAEAHAKLGLARLRTGDRALAEAEFRKALEVSDQFPDLHYHLGVLAEQDGRPDEAEQRLRHALAIHPDYVEARGYLGLTLLGRGRADEAREEIAEAARRGLPLPDGFALIPAADVPAALVDELRTQIEKQSIGSMVLSNALESYSVGQVEAAITELDAAVKEHPTYADLRCRLGRLLAETGKHEEALAQFAAALE
ncbi:MAG TPA: tetratricopeptide repeat protein, partial [Candidatus Eisenbacteria bacterium]